MAALPTDRLVVVDVGHGSCAVLHDSGKTSVIDAGPGTSLLEYLTKEKISTVDLVLLSHADEDHVGGVLGLIASRAISVEKVYVNADASKLSKVWDDLLYELDNNDSLKVGLNKSMPEFAIGNSIVNVLAPSAYLAGKSPGSTDHRGRRITSNAISAMLHLSHKGKAVAVFTGDIDPVGLENWLEGKKTDVHAPILIFPHHGGSVGGKHTAQFTQAMLDHVNPSAVVFSFGHVGRGSIKPNQEVVEVIQSYGKPIRIICTQISKHCVEAVPKAEPSHLLPIHARGREDGRCCAGSLVIDLDAPETILPDEKAHETFIRSKVSTPICMD